MEYRFFDTGDDELIRISELPCENGIAIALRTCSYEHERNEVVELAICDLNGKELFCRRVNPQNVEDWVACEASGGLSPADVEDLPELYQFEDDVIELVNDADVVVCQHLPFAEEAIEASWVSLPDHRGVDLVDFFCQTHCAADYPGKPAATAALAGIAAYYDLAAPDGSLIGEAALIGACYRALVAEHASEREAKGAEYWKRYEESKAGDAAENARRAEIARVREHRLNQMNGLLWFTGAIIFISLAIQLYQRGADMGLIVICGAVAVFTIIRGIANFRK